VANPINIVGDPDADAFLDRDAFALLVGMLLDQQMPMERAFAGAWRLAGRLGTTDRFVPAAIAAAEPEKFAALASKPPAIHRFPASMAGRIQSLATVVIDEYDGDASAIWSTGSGVTVLARLEALPGFGAQKARIFLALLGKQRGVRPTGWRKACEPYGEARSYRSVADVVDADSLAKVRALKQAAKAAARAAD
jgi:uncharacterized HhH-GPD family protein